MLMQRRVEAGSYSGAGVCRWIDLPAILAELVPPTAQIEITLCFYSPHALAD